MFDRIRTVGEALRCRRMGRLDVVFFCSSATDAQWVRSTFEACDAQSLRTAVVLGAPSVEGGSSVAWARERLFVLPPHRLGLLSASILVSPSSGVRFAALPAGCRHVVHLPHSLVSLHMAYPEGSFDAFDSIFATGEHHVQEAQRLRATHPLQAMPVGYARFDQLPASAPRGGMPAIAIAPSWGEPNTLDLVGESLVRRLLGRGFDVIVRPHPAWSAGPKPSRAQRFAAPFLGADRFTLEDARCGMGSLLDADLLISDYSGAAFEYAFSTLKPVLFVDAPMKIMNASWGSLGLEPFELAYRPKVGRIVRPDVATIVEAVDALLASGASHAPAIARARDGAVFNFGRCGETAATRLTAMAASRRAVSA